MKTIIILTALLAFTVSLERRPFLHNEETPPDSTSQDSPTSSSGEKVSNKYVGYAMQYVQAVDKKWFKGENFCTAMTWATLMVGYMIM